MYGDVSQAPLYQHWGLNRVSDWNLKLCWFPKKCFLSQKNIWWKYAYYGENLITGPGEPILEQYWIEKSEFLIWNLKGKT